MFTQFLIGYMKCIEEHIHPQLQMTLYLKIMRDYCVNSDNIKELESYTMLQEGLSRNPDWQHAFIETIKILKMEKGI